MDSTICARINYLSIAIAWTGVNEGWTYPEIKPKPNSHLNKGIKVIWLLYIFGAFLLKNIHRQIKYPNQQQNS